MLEIKARGKYIEDGSGGRSLFISNGEWWLTEQRKFEPGRAIKITITYWYNERSAGQNKFYWKYFMQAQIDCFAEFWGEVYSKKDIHDWNKMMFWGEEKVNELTGEVIMAPGSSANKSTVEFEEKLEIIRHWFRLHFEWEIPYPNEQGDLNFKK